MTGWASGLAALALLAAPTVHAADRTVPHSTLFTFRDDELFESSGLVDRGRVVYTADDSGGGPVLSGVDSRTGRTVSRTTYADEVTDVEALAPGAHGSVWTGDIGDNRGNRDDVSVYQVQPLGGDRPAPRYRLAYPDGPHDAETLLVRPGTGRVFVVTKSVFGGRVYAAPRRLRTDRVNRLTPFAQVPGLVTDGTFLPSGRSVLLRTYGKAAAYTFPGFRQVGSVRLPPQPQGEGIAVSATGRVLLSSEGVHSAVLRVVLPAVLTAPPRTAAPAPTPPPIQPPASRPVPRDGRDWAGIALAAAVVAGVGLLAVRSSRVRGPGGGPR